MNDAGLFTGSRGRGRAMGEGRPVVQEHFHAFHAFIHPAWPDGSCQLITGREVAGKPGSEDRSKGRLGLRPPGCPPKLAGEPDYRRVALR